jgi:hypothetical protein
MDQRCSAQRRRTRSTTSAAAPRAQHAVSAGPGTSRDIPRQGRNEHLPQFVNDEFDAFLECGILAHGFLRLRCAECAHENLAAFSCKRRRFCPSCGARRMAETAAHLVDYVIARVPVRQWVLSFPIPLRTLLAAHPQLVSPVLQVSTGQSPRS